jgi:HD-GYP domain-containing protein (c-di-GMP phosphodiesterase class II)
MLAMHPSVAADILSQAPALRGVVPIVFHHHEHFDGNGYSGGVSGESIPYGARILAVADAFVAMTSDRPYRRALSTRQALAELTDEAGTQFDPVVVEALVDLVDSESDRVPHREP